MKSQKLRLIIPIAVLLIAGLAFTLNVDFGTLDGFGLGTISLLCPLGALSAMIAAKMAIPRAIVSLVLFVIVVLIAGRAYCAWVCPTPVLSRIRELFVRKGSDEEFDKDVDVTPLTEREKALLRSSCGGSCAERHGAIDSRHFVLGGTILSAAIFGFPVFCLICPIGLSFALIFFLVRAFGFGDPSIALIIIPVVLILELVVFRKWCHWICPISALMSLVAKGNKTLQPKVDNALCLETAKPGSCGRCAMVCSERINPRYPDLGNSMSECIRCRACVEACPAGALSMPFYKKDGETPATEAAPAEVAED